MQNTKRIQDEEQSGSDENVVEEKKPRRKKKSVLGMFDIGKWIGYDSVVRNLPFILFIAFLGIVYIWNEHRVEKNIIETNSIEKQMKQLNWEYTTSKSELEYSSKKSEVAKMVVPDGLEVLRVPPKKIVTASHGN